MEPENPLLRWLRKQPSASPRRPGLSAKRFADANGISATTLYHFINGERGNMDATVIGRIVIGTGGEVTAQEIIDHIMQRQQQGNSNGTARA